MQKGSMLPVVLLVVVAMFFASFLSSSPTGQYLYPERADFTPRMKLLDEINAPITPLDLGESSFDDGSDPGTGAAYASPKCPFSLQCDTNDGAIRAFKGEAKEKTAAEAERKALAECNKKWADPNPPVGSSIKCEEYKVFCKDTAPPEKTCTPKMRLDKQKGKECAITKCTYWERKLPNPEEDEVGHFKPMCSYKYDKNGKLVENPKGCKKKYAVAADKAGYLYWWYCAAVAADSVIDVYIDCTIKE